MDNILRCSSEVFRMNACIGIDYVLIMSRTYCHKGSLCTPFKISNNHKF